MLQRFTQEPLAFDSGIRCVGGDVEQCRSYTLHTVLTYKPKRIICVSEGAALAVLGRSHGEGAIKRWYGYFNGIPVFVVPDALRAVRNRFLKAEFAKDVEWAVSHVPMADPKDLTCAVPASQEETILAVQEATALGVPVAVDCEWSGNSENDNFRLISIALAVDDKSWVWDEKALQSERVSQPLREFFLSKHPKVGHHAKADIRSLWTWLEQSPVNFNEDTRLMWKVQAPEADGGLDACADMVGMGGHKVEAKKALEKAVKTVRKLALPTNMFDKLPPDAADNPYAYAFAYIPRDTLLRYNALDTVATHRLWREMTQRLESQPTLQKTLKRTVMPASLSLAQVEKWGVLIDQGALDAYSAFLSQRLAEVRQKLTTYGDFNPASGPELSELLYKKLKLKVPFKTDSGKPSTDKDALAEIAKVHPIGADLLEFRKVTKHEGTYAVGLRNCITSDGRIHPFYNTDGAETGRISCSQPNLQNVPRADSDEGKMARNLFVAGHGKVLVQADYSQLELRVAAALSGDTKMLEIFHSGVDYHQRTAEMVSKVAWGISPEQVEKKHRTAAKSINFGLLYGRGDSALAEQMGSTREDAAKVRAAVLGNFRKLAADIEASIKMARQTGEVWTSWDGQPARRRSMVGIADPDDGLKSAAERQSYNTRVQGSASDLCLASVADIVRWINEDCVPAKLVLTVHDSIMVECDKSVQDEVVYQMRRIMESQPCGGVPIVVDVEVGESWGSLTKVK